MASAKLVLDKRAPKKDGTFPVKIYVNHKGDFYLPTGIDIKVEFWIGDSEAPTENKRYNTVLIQMLTRMRSMIYQLRADGKLEAMSKDALKYYLKNAGEEKEDQVVTIAMAFFRSAQAAAKAGTKSVYLQTLEKIKSYYNVDVISLHEVNSVWLRDFEQKMIVDGLAINTISVHLRTFRAVFNRAIDDEIVGQEWYPFRKFKIKSERTRKRSLTIDQLRTLRNYPCQDHQLKYRDLFMLIFYLEGINVVDLLNLKHINVDRVEFRRAKTGRLYSIKVEPEAMEIIERYRGKDYLLDVLDNYGNHKDFLHRMNKNLQQIGPFEMVNNAAKDPLRVKKNKKQITPLFPDLTTYWARHTWATIAAGLDIPKETIAAALGHGGDSVTDIYIDFDQRKVDAANRRVIDYVNDLIAEE